MYGGEILLKNRDLFYCYLKLKRFRPFLDLLLPRTSLFLLKNILACFIFLFFYFLLFFPSTSLYYFIRKIIFYKCFIYNIRTYEMSFLRRNELD